MKNKMLITILLILLCFSCDDDKATKIEYTVVEIGSGSTPTWQTVGGIIKTFSDSGFANTIGASRHIGDTIK